MGEVYDGIRYLNLVLALVTMIGTARGLRWIWARVPTEPRLSRLSVIMFAFAVFFGTVEQLRGDIPGGPRTIVFTVALIFSTITALLPRERRLFPTPPEHR